MLKDAMRRKFDVVMVWAVDRLGRSLPDLIASMQDLHGAKVDLFSEFERAMIQSRVKAGLQWAQAEQAAGKVRRDTQGRRLKAIGRPRISGATEAAIRDAWRPALAC